MLRAINPKAGRNERRRGARASSGPAKSRPSSAAARGHHIGVEAWLPLDPRRWKNKKASPTTRTLIADRARALIHHRAALGFRASSADARLATSGHSAEAVPAAPAFARTS